MVKWVILEVWTGVWSDSGYASGDGNTSVSIIIIHNLTFTLQHKTLYTRITLTSRLEKYIIECKTWIYELQDTCIMHVSSILLMISIL